MPIPYTHTSQTLITDHVVNSMNVIMPSIYNLQSRTSNKQITVLWYECAEFPTTFFLIIPLRSTLVTASPVVLERGRLHEPSNMHIMNHSTNAALSSPRVVQTCPGKDLSVNFTATSVKFPCSSWTVLPLQFKKTLPFHAYTWVPYTSRLYAKWFFFQPLRRKKDFYIPYPK